MGAIAHTHQNRTNFNSIGNRLQYVAGCPGSIRICVDQNIRLPGKSPAREQAFAQHRIQSGIGMCGLALNEVLPHFVWFIRC